MVFAFGHKVHRTIDRLLLVLGNGLEVVEVSLKNVMQILEDQNVRVDVDHIVEFSAFSDELLQEGVSCSPMVQIIVGIPAEKKTRWSISSPAFMAYTSIGRGKLHFRLKTMTSL